MCNLYSITTNHAAIIALFRVMIYTALADTAMLYVVERLNAANHDGQTVLH